MAFFFYIAKCSSKWKFIQIKCAIVVVVFFLIDENKIDKIVLLLANSRLTNIYQHFYVLFRYFSILLYFIYLTIIRRIVINYEKVRCTNYFKPTFEHVNLNSTEYKYIKILSYCATVLNAV